MRPKGWVSCMKEYTRYLIIALFFVQIIFQGLNMTDRQTVRLVQSIRLLLSRWRMLCFLDLVHILDMQLKFIKKCFYFLAFFRYHFFWVHCNSAILSLPKWRTAIRPALIVEDEYFKKNLGKQCCNGGLEKCIESGVEWLTSMMVKSSKYLPNVVSAGDCKELAWR